MLYFFARGCPGNGINPRCGADIGGIPLPPGPCSGCVAPHGRAAPEAPRACPGLCQRLLVPNIIPAAGELGIVLVERAGGCLIAPGVGELLVNHFCPKKDARPGLGTALEWDAPHQRCGTACVAVNLTHNGNGSPGASPDLSALISLPEHSFLPSTLVSPYIPCILAPGSPETSLPLFQLCRGGC